MAIGNLATASALAKGAQAGRYQLANTILSALTLTFPPTHQALALVNHDSTLYSRSNSIRVPEFKIQSWQELGEKGFIGSISPGELTDVNILDMAIAGMADIPDAGTFEIPVAEAAPEVELETGAPEDTGGGTDVQSSMEATLSIASKT